MRKNALRNIPSTARDRYRSHELWALQNISQRENRPGVDAAGCAIDSIFSTGLRGTECEPIGVPRCARNMGSFYSTVTDFAKFLGWSTSHPRRTAM